ncbi:MAG: hypothetical protein A3F10_03005 [Coxiella sp. RIFCSPHIGHO2_12_FULL_42_15]|nr:MAG: hypothetical protein A3F10_03005 [Coxiella sp. RIFCSPHIGHO2_12_FULL_42_15]
MPKKITAKITYAFFLFFLFGHCGAQSMITQSFFGNLPGNKTPVLLFQLKNNTGMQVNITNYRGIITQLIVPGFKKCPYDVVLGYDSLSSYLKDSATYFGALVGRYANRIKAGEFSLDGTAYQLNKNDRGNTLHSGGVIGFNNAIWTPKIKETGDALSLELHFVQPDKDQGFPGQLDTTVTYTLPKNKNQLEITYTATTNKKTIINLTNHSYFNLSGEGSGSILNQWMKINAHQYTPTDENQIPTGVIASVQNTPFDFRTSHSIGEKIQAHDTQLKIANGYDHNFIIDAPKADTLTLAAQAYSPLSGIEMSVYTTQPGIQFYSGNFLTKDIIGKSGHVYDFRGGFALETQHYPDSPHHSNFPTTVLNPGEVYQQKTIYAFCVRSSSRDT